MKILMKTWRALLPSIAALAVLATLGCAEGTTRKDVAGARDNLEKEKQETSEAVREAQRDVADAQKAQEHTAAKPVTPDQPTTDQREVADAQQDAAEKIAKQKEQERAAAAELADKEQAFQATQARDAYVKDVETKLAETDKQIDTLKERASNAQGADKDALNRQVDMMKTQRDMAQKALNDLKGADLASWKNHQEHVRLALQDLDKSTRTIR
jgi:pilus assembly protein FimV